jgi:hypothetical protein
MSLSDGIEIAQALTLGTATAVSNGSYKDGRGTSAFIIEKALHKQED